MDSAGKKKKTTLEKEKEIKFKPESS